MLQVRLPTNFKAARFGREQHTALLRELADGIEAARYQVDGESIDLPVKLKVHDSVFVPLAKWAMLMTGNYRCLMEIGVRTIKEAVHDDIEASQSLYDWVVDLCVLLGADCGDMVPFERTVTTAIGHGKKAARAIDSWLRGRVRGAHRKHGPASFDALHPWFHLHTMKHLQRTIEIERRCRTFDEVLLGFDRVSARSEARRCLSCGNCFECDGCYSACPERAVIKLGAGRRYRFDLEKCTGCAICYDQCPCGAIAMITEPLPYFAGGSMGAGLEARQWLAE